MSDRYYVKIWLPQLRRYDYKENMTLAEAQVTQAKSHKTGEDRSNPHSDPRRDP